MINPNLIPEVDQHALGESDTADTSQLSSPITRVVETMSSEFSVGKVMNMGPLNFPRVEIGNNENHTAVLDMRKFIQFIALRVVALQKFNFKTSMKIKFIQNYNVNFGSMCVVEIKNDFKLLHVNSIYGQNSHTVADVINATTPTTIKMNEQPKTRGKHIISVPISCDSFDIFTEEIFGMFRHSFIFISPNRMSDDRKWATS